MLYITQILYSVNSFMHCGPRFQTAGLPSPRVICDRGCQTLCHSPGPNIASSMFLCQRSAFQRPCRLQYAYTETGVSSIRAKETIGFSPGTRAFLCPPRSVCKYTHWMPCSSVIGWAAAPTLTLTRFPSLSAVGKCFSADASVSPGIICRISWPQHIRGTPASLISPTILPQFRQI